MDTTETDSTPLLPPHGHAESDSGMEILPAAHELRLRGCTVLFFTSPHFCALQGSGPPGKPRPMWPEAGQWLPLEGRHCRRPTRSFPSPVWKPGCLWRGATGRWAQARREAPLELDSASLEDTDPGGRREKAPGPEPEHGQGERGPGPGHGSPCLARVETPQARRQGEGAAPGGPPPDHLVLPGKLHFTARQHCRATWEAGLGTPTWAPWVP